MHNVRTKEGEEQLSEVTDLVQLAVVEMWQKIQNRYIVPLRRDEIGKGKMAAFPVRDD